MEYQLLSDPQNKVRLIMSMGYEAMAAWFNTEVVDDESLLVQISAGIALLKGTQQQWQHYGKEYSICITDDAVTVKANYLWHDAELPQEDMNFYDAEAQCCCGIEDFCQLMQAWRQFASTGT